jgi:toxin-antitoxin system PIN domain toxin
VFVVDTNVLVYAANADSPHHSPCREMLEAWRDRASAWYLTWGIVYEFLSVMTNPRAFDRPWSAPQAWAFVEALLASPGLGVLAPTERHNAVAGEVLRELPHLGGRVMYDAQVAVLMREHGINRIYTRDTDFHRFPFLQPLDPLIENE